AGKKVFVERTPFVRSIWRLCTVVTQDARHMLSLFSCTAQPLTTTYAQPSHEPVPALTKPAWVAQEEQRRCSNQKQHTRSPPPPRRVLCTHQTLPPCWGASELN
ncbi:unnamed protein product, partial [Ectocarpus sp. 12 AP-2014]